MTSPEAAVPVATDAPTTAGADDAVPAPPAPAPSTPAPSTPGPGGRTPFEVTLENFSGPFDLLLSLIAKHRLDITEVALAQVTDEFIAHLSGQAEWDLGQASEFLLVAATLLDLKAARLLPRGEVDDEDDLELLEARDLLFARLLQYRAYKEVAADLERRWATNARSYPRSVSLEPHFAALLPELVLRVGPERLAELAARAFAPKPGPPQVDLSHLHAPVVPVREQAMIIVARLRRARSSSFRTLTEDAESTAVVVSRFLALLELFREGAIAFEQAEALGELRVTWMGSDEGDVTITADYDDEQHDDGEQRDGEGPAPADLDDAVIGDNGVDD